MDTSNRAPRILVVGGGYVGMYTALRLQRRLRPGEATITVVDPLSFMTYQPFLPEAAAGSLEPRHVVVPLRRVLPKAQILTGRVTRVDHGTKTAWVMPLEGAEFALSYDVLVMAPGSVARTLPIPGLAETGVAFKTVAEAIYLRNHVISRLDVAATTTDPDIKRRALNFLVVGGGYAGIECLAELEDMARDAMRFYPNLTPRDMRWVLVEATGRILPEVSESLGVYTVEQLRARAIEVRLSTRVNSLVGGHAELDDGTEFDTDTVIWTAGVKPHPVLRETDLPLDDKGRIKATEYLTVDGVENAWTAGDCAAIPDLTNPGQYTGPSAQHAVRQAQRLGDNIIASLRGQRLTAYKHSYAGSVASLGLHKGVAEIYGFKLRGLPAWWMHRTYHLSRVPTFNRKVRVVTDWTIALFFRREVVSLGSLMRPREEWERITEQPQSSARAG
jgi:NADH dehydrogenase